MKASRLYRMPRLWGFNPETGCIYHPGGYLTSWVRREPSGWVASDLAVAFLPEAVWSALAVGFARETLAIV